VNVPIFGFVENMAYFQCGNCSEKTYIFGKDGCKHLAAEVSKEATKDSEEIVTRERDIHIPFSLILDPQDGSGLSWRNSSRE
jgi:Mrp family chromosome partitioning ATPase